MDTVINMLITLMAMGYLTMLLLSTKSEPSEAIKEDIKELKVATDEIKEMGDRVSTLSTQIDKVDTELKKYSLLLQTMDKSFTEEINRKITELEKEAGRCS